MRGTLVAIVRDGLRCPVMKKLTVKMERFARAYVGDANGDACKAYRLSYDAGKMKDRTIADCAYELLADQRIKDRIEELRQKISEMVELKKADVLNLWSKIATADPNEIVQHRRGACRFCHGFDHAYQFTTEAEFEMARIRAMDAGQEGPLSTGGFGYDLNAPAHPKCPQCFGDGVGRVFLADTRRLTGAAKLLYAGIKQTKDGIEIKLRDQDAALANIAKHFGMLNNKWELSGPNGTPLPVIPVVAHMDAIEAGQAYQKFITGK